jgi:hypothetical protein
MEGDGKTRAAPPCRDNNKKGAQKFLFWLGRYPDAKPGGGGSPGHMGGIRWKALDTNLKDLFVLVLFSRARAKLRDKAIAHQVCK